MVDRGPVGRIVVANPKTTTLMVLYAVVVGLCATGLAVGP
jgi:hypothetical protein